MAKFSILPLIWFLSLAGSANAQTALEPQKAANDVLRSQLSKEGKDCQDARDNFEDKACISLAAQQTETDFAVFYQNLKELLDASGQSNLEEAQRTWTPYRDATCKAIDEFFREGSARVGLVTRCRIQLTRSRMKDLDAIYNLPLHH